MPAEDMTIRAGWSVVVVNPDGSSTSTEVDTSTTTDGATVTTTTVTETDASGESKTNVTTDIPPMDEGGENVVKDEYVDVAIEQIETLPIDSDVPIVINVPVGDSGAASVSPGSMADISEIDAGLKITATIGSILLDKDVCEKMSSATENIRVSINKAVENDLTEAQKKAIGDRFALVLRAVSGSSDFHELGGNATVQIPYTLRDGQDASKLRLIHINDAGEKEIIESNYGNGIMNAKIGHFSVFYIDVVEENNGGGFPMIAIVGIVAAVVVVGVALFYIRSRN